ncbi:MAG TPA: hypothetical protein VE291_04525 [Terracidiphilus sp.]|jgi:hypothetical protein|nr:hypothetical protein [Terracidiphilus sp.]
MRVDGFQLNGPGIRPVKHWLIGGAINLFCLGILALGLSPGFPVWLKELGWTVYLLLLLGGSVYLVVRFFFDRHKKGRGVVLGPLGLYPRSWQRWLVGESDEKPEKLN